MVRHLRSFEDAHPRLVPKHPDIDDPVLETPRPKQKAKSWFIGKITRNSSSKNLKDVHSRSALARKSSIGSLLGRRTKYSMTAQSLGDLYRIGGIAVLHLPPRFIATPLALPICLAATAQFLAEHGIQGSFAFSIGLR